MIHPCILDASALLALIFNEPGADRVRDVLDHSTIHVVNLIEVVLKLVSLGIPHAEVVEQLNALQLNVVEEFSAQQAYDIGTFGAEARRLGLSLGDCICLMLARSVSGQAITADRRWGEIQLPGLDVVQIR